MKKLTRKRYEELWDEVEEAIEIVEAKDYHTGIKKVLQRIELGKTALEIFYCGTICEHILNHVEEELLEEEAEEEIGKKRYIN